MKRIPGVILFFSIILIFSVSAAALQVKPLVLNFDLEPGDSEEFELILTGGLQRQRVTLNLMHPTQNINGRLSYSEVEESFDNPALDWIEFENREVILPAEEETVVRGRINVPFDAGGSHTAVVMIDQEDPFQRPEAMVGFRIRYAIRININIDRPGQRPTVDVWEFSLDTDAEGRPVITTHFQNNSPLSYNAVADVTIRGEDRRLVERVPVFSPATSLERRDNFLVYPGSELIYRGEVTEQLLPGTYEIQLFFRYADGRQVIRRQSVEVEQGFFREEEPIYLTMEPEELDISLRPGAASTRMMEFKNNFNETLILDIHSGDIMSEYANSLYNSHEVSVRGENRLALDPGRSFRQVMTFRAPRDLDPGGYYGLRNIDVYNLEGEMIESHSLSISSVVEGEILKEAEIQDLSFNRGESFDTFSVSIKNSGNIHISPHIRMQLLDEEGELYANLRLSLHEEQQVLPGFSNILTGERRLVDSGDYTAVVTLESGGEEIAARNFELTVAGD